MSNHRPPFRADAHALLQRALVWDNHACMPLRPDDPSFLPQLEEHRLAGANVVVLNIGMDMNAATPDLPFRMLGQFRQWVREHPEHYLLIQSVEDIERARAQNKLGVCFDLEGGALLQGDPGLISVYYDLGVRWMLIAYNQQNALGSGGHVEDTGLTAYGRRVIDEMQRVGMVLCCSHTGYRTALEAIEYSQQPVIFSHSNPAALHEQPRNIPDELIRACAASGGVVNLTGIGIFLGANDDSTETFVRHVEYVTDLVGPEHVGLGLDYVFDQQEINDLLRDHPELYPPEQGYADGIGMIGPARLPEIVQVLMQRAWTEKDIRALLGENNLRVARQVWK